MQANLPFSRREQQVQRPQGGSVLGTLKAEEASVIEQSEKEGG